MRAKKFAPAVSKKIPLDLPPQPTATSCGPTCLYGVYRYYGMEQPLEQIIREVEATEGGGTLGVLLGNHALQNGFAVRMYTYNLRVFDPTWFPAAPEQLADKLRASLPHRRKSRQRQVIQAYIRFCELGGEVCMEVLNGALIRKPLKRNHPILTGLSSTFLYRDMRSNPVTNQDDDLGGEAEGHFVLLSGYNQQAHTIQILDPYAQNPLADSRRYSVGMDELINAILLGILTYDANLLIIQPRL
jgi:hypothetical protein